MSFHPAFVVLPKLYFTQSSYIRIVKLKKTNNRERHFPEKASSQTPFHRSHSTMLYSSSVLFPPKHWDISPISTPDQDGDRFQYNSLFLNSKSFPMKDYFDATTVPWNILVKFLNFSCVTSCDCLTHSACTTHSLLHSQSWWFHTTLSLL